MTIYALCAVCGGYLDRDSSICRGCGADNDSSAPEAFDDRAIDLSGVELDRLNPWSKIKHEIIEKYAAAYTTILRRQPYIRRYVYIDAFAGAGVAVDAESDELIAAGAMRALNVEPRFHEYHFIEQNPDKAALLREVTAHRNEAQVHTGDFGEILPNLLDRCQWKDFARGLCLLDPYGLSVDYELLKKIAAMKTVEIFFNFMLVGANRNVLWNVDPATISPRRAALMTRVWGHDRWPDELYEREKGLFGDIHTKVSNERVIDAYRKRLLEAGFTYVPKPIAMKNRVNAPVYYLYFASPNKTGASIVEQILNSYR
jgi:three-Cys-motif partner protein